MATRSYISKQLSDGSLTGIYCHWDGHPDSVGATLQKHYTDPTKVDALLALGSISSLEPELGEKHDFDAPTKGWTIAYHRDRGEELDPPVVYSTLRDMLRSVGSDLNAEYAYVFVSPHWEFYEV